MKRLCKDIDITNIDLIQKSVYKCLKGKSKDRYDIRRIFEQYGNIKNISLALQNELLNRNLELLPIWYKNKYDSGSQKMRTIGIQDIKQQMYDYIAVEGLKELIKRIGTYQCASIPKRGQLYGAYAIQRWLRKKVNGKYEVQYACKFDIRKYYESIPREKLMAWLRKHVKNEPLLWLVETLINTFKKGLSIGSYLSQYLGNLYLSDLYHMIKERLYRERHKKDGIIKRVMLVLHALFYMDDILILGSNSRNLMLAAQVIIQTLKEMGLAVKDSWRCFKITEDSFIDMMGYRIYRDHITVRRGTFKKIKRACFRFKRKPKSFKLAKRLLSFKGILEHSDSLSFMQGNSLYALFRKARKVVSNEYKILRAETELRTQGI